MRPVLLAFLTLLPVACGGGGSSSPSTVDPLIARDPQLAQADSDSIVVAWRTTEPVLGAVLLDSGERFVGEAATREHVIRITGLAADRDYGYSLEHDGVALAAGWRLRTAPVVGQGVVRFVVIGDSGTGGEDQYDIAADMERSDPDLVLITGDVAYDDGAEHEIDRGYFRPYRWMLPLVPFYPVLGNHDVHTENGRPLLDALYLPRNDADGSERFFSFDRGPVHFIGLDSNQSVASGSVQGDWLAADLAANQRRWTVIYLHHPPYSSSRHGSDASIQAALRPLCDLHGVDVVFAGHDHVYERTHAIAGDAVVDDDPLGDYVDPAGTVYVVTGGGGRYLYEAGESWFTAASIAMFHHVVVEVSANTLTLQALDRDETVRDSMTISKSP